MASVPLPVHDNQSSWNEMLRRLGRNFRINPANSTEKSLIDDAVDAFSSAYPWLSYRFYGKTAEGRRLSRLGQLMDDVGVEIDSGLHTSLVALCNGLDIKRFVG